MTKYCNGTLGDAYMMVLKLYGSEDLDIKFHCAYPNLYPTIRDIFSLLGDVKFEEISKSELEKHKTFVGYIDDDEIGMVKNPFPQWELPSINKFNLPENYQVVQLNSGVDAQKTPWKKLDKDVTDHLSPLPIILLGTDNSDISFLGDVIDLRGKTTLLESFSILENSNHFYATQGLLTFFALSQKVSSTVWIKHPTDVRAVNYRIERIPEWEKFRMYI